MGVSPLVVFLLDQGADAAPFACRVEVYGAVLTLERDHTTDANQSDPDNSADDTGRMSHRRRIALICEKIGISRTASRQSNGTLF